MSWLSALPIIGNIVGGPVEKIIDKLGEDERREFELAFARLDQEFKTMQAQARINEKAAEHPSMFVAGARSFILWVCGLGFAFHFLGIAGIVQHYTGAPVVVDLNTLYPLMLGLLGMGGLRTYEKLKGVQRNSL